jgi:hypothetical protein
MSELESDLPKRLSRTLKALKLGMDEAARQAPRWIQWSIKGGGWADADPPAPPAPPKPKAKKAKAKNAATKKAKAKKSRSGKMRTPKKATAPKRASARRPSKKAKKTRIVRAKGPRANPCPRRTPPEYREPVDTGDYKNSFKIVRQFGAVNPRIDVVSSAKPAVKAGVIELGRRLAPIPISPLADWVRRKLGCRDPKKARSIAFAISRTATVRRRKGLKVIARARAKIREEAQLAVRKAYARERT